MESSPKLFLISGVPGSGKTTLVNQILGSKTDHLIYDIDWLLYSASALSGKDVQINSATWPAYNAVWIDVLAAAGKNGISPVLFSPWDNRDLHETSLDDHFAEVHWLCLDCTDKVLISRLKERRYSDQHIANVLDDAAYLRQNVSQKLDTTSASPEQTATEILSWLTGPT